MIPLVDLKTQYKSIKEEIMEVVTKVLESSVYVLGEEVECFEEEFARYCGVKYCTSVSTGTDALYLALLALGIGEGDEVITTPNTFIATAEAISHTGAVPVFVDVEEDTHNIDPDKIEEKITKKTSAIIPVHLYGHPADMDPILEIAKRHNLFVIEDACQAHGASYKGKKAGSMGVCGCFSFYPGKNLGAYGEGGAVTTDDEEIVKKIKMLRDHGQPRKHEHKIKGFNARLHTIQAAILRVKLKHLDEWNNARRKAATLYNKYIKTDTLIKPTQKEYAESVWHLYVIRTKRRDALSKFLREKGIFTGLHYPVPIHLQAAYKELGHKKGDFPISEKLAEEVLSLPMFPELSEAQIQYIAAQIEDFFR